MAGPPSWFVVSLHYVAPLRAIDAAMKSHVAFLERQRRAGVFIAWGRKVPRTGGIILARGESRAGIERIMEDDPLVARKLAEVEVTEFLPSRPSWSTAFAACSTLKTGSRSGGEVPSLAVRLGGFRGARRSSRGTSPTRGERQRIGGAPSIVRSGRRRLSCPPRCRIVETWCSGEGEGAWSVASGHGRTRTTCAISIASRALNQAARPIDH